MTRLIEAAKPNASNENNLDRWVGYAPTPEERKLLETKISELEKTRLLIEEVGSFRPAGISSTETVEGTAHDSSSAAPEGTGGTRAATGADVPVYDLAGNVAEWATDKNGGRVMGLSAVSVRDPSTPYETPRFAYVGFRVRAE
jgi:formylglycine-generating enzyme required for sulfatase activity